MTTRHTRYTTEGNLRFSLFFFLRRPLLPTVERNSHGFLCFPFETSLCLLVLVEVSGISKNQRVRGAALCFWEALG